MKFVPAHSCTISKGRSKYYQTSTKTSVDFCRQLHCGECLMMTHHHRSIDFGTTGTPITCIICVLVSKRYAWRAEGYRYIFIEPAKQVATPVCLATTRRPGEVIRPLNAVCTSRRRAGIWVCSRSTASRRTDRSCLPRALHRLQSLERSGGLTSDHVQANPLPNAAPFPSPPPRFSFSFVRRARAVLLHLHRFTWWSRQCETEEERMFPSLQFQ